MTAQQIRSQNDKPGSCSFSADNVRRYRQLLHFLPHSKSDMAVYTHLSLIAQFQTQLSEVEDSVVGNAEQLSSLPTAPLLAGTHKCCSSLTRLRCPGLFLLQHHLKFCYKNNLQATLGLAHVTLCPTWELPRAIQNKNERTF